MEHIQLLSGLVLIAIFASERFSTPATVRASTTAGRYYSASTIYLLIYLITFFVFTKYPTLLDAFNVNLKSALGFDPGPSDTVLAAVILSILVPKIPVIATVDDRLRSFLHRLAAIPYEAIRLSGEIRASEYQVPAAVWESVTTDLKEQGFPLEELNLDDPIIRGWVEVASLMTQLQAWNRSNQFSTFVQERGGQFERLNESYGRLNKMALNAITLDQRAKAHPETGALREAANAFLGNLQSAQRSLLSEICDFISHGVLQKCFRLDSRQRLLYSMGFVNVTRESDPGLTVNQTIMLMGLLLGLLLGNFILFRPPSAEGEATLLRVVMIVSIYAAAVTCAVVPKHRWSVFQYDEAQGYPTFGYLLSGLMAVIASAGISIFFNTLIFASSPGHDGLRVPMFEAWTRFSTGTYPWLTMAFASAVCTAFLIDWRWPVSVRPVLARLVQGATQACLLMSVAMLVHWWLASLGESGNPHVRVPDLTHVIRVTALVGFTIGYLVPTWYRESAAKVQSIRGDRISTEQRAAPRPPLEEMRVVRHLRISH